MRYCSMRRGWSSLAPVHCRIGCPQAGRNPRWNDWQNIGQPLHTAIRMRLDRRPPRSSAVPRPL